MGELIDMRAFFESALEANGWTLNDDGHYEPPDEE